MERTSLTISSRLYALAGVLIFFGLIWLYTREYAVFTNMINTRWLVAGALVAGAAAGGGILLGLRHKFQPWDKHVPEFFTILFFSMVFAPLFASLFNRAWGRQSYEPFVFVAEVPYLASGYGFLKGQPVKPAGFELLVKEKERLLHFRYKKQRYFPLSQPGDTVLLPVRTGLLGFRVVELK